MSKQKTLRPYIPKQLYYKIKESYPETRSLTVTGLTCWALEKLLAQKEKS